MRYFSFGYEEDVPMTLARWIFVIVIAAGIAAAIFAITRDKPKKASPTRVYQQLTALHQEGGLFFALQ